MRQFIIYILSFMFLFLLSVSDTMLSAYNNIGVSPALVWYFIFGLCVICLVSSIVLIFAEVLTKSVWFGYF